MRFLGNLIGSYNRLKSYIQTAIDMDELQDIELRKKLGIDNTKMIETIQSF